MQSGMTKARIAVYMIQREMKGWLLALSSRKTPYRVAPKQSRNVKVGR